MESRRRRNTGIEENTMAILDASGFNHDHHYVKDDSNSFLEAVRSASIVPENGIAPTKKMFEAIFHILKDENSMDLIMASYQLLNELDKRFPRVYISRTEKIESSSPHTASPELTVVKEAWSPFIFGLDIAYGERGEADKSSGGSLDSAGFHLLVQSLAKVADERKFEASETKSLRNLLLFQYLVNVLEGDFLPRNCVFKETMNWILLRESLLNILLGSRKISYKGLIKDCLSIMCEMCHICSSDLLKNCDTAIGIALPEVEKGTCNAVQKLLLMIMELDLSKKAADVQGHTTRADAVRTPLEEIILDELTYNRDFLSPFLEVFNEPKRKLDIIVQYFSKYIAKPSSVRTRRSNGSTEDTTFNGILKCFSNGNSTKSVTKKISTDVVQLLLAHGFQAYFSLASQDSVEGISDFKEDFKGSLMEICKNVISAFTSLRRTDGKMEILPFGKEALFTAASVLSTK
ncbi:negative regulator of systemic acquired resistance SNI1 [Cornus florida]|uniref:negative regulator of systemic acquired resistance SNI1 n=1 Tax=Cornus florida TaxID=4283 RepID=UPI0028A2C631|nr:negative regulator of systemic acquired resistance SNI1 [Cornus florida]